MKNKKKNTTLMYILLLLVVVISGYGLYSFNQSQNEEVRLNEESNIGELQDVENFGSIRNESSSNGVQGFTFTGLDELTVENNIWNFQGLIGKSGPFRYTEGDSQRSGKDCPVGSAIRFLKEDSNGEYTIDIFNDLWFKSSTNDLIRFDDYQFVKDMGTFKYSYLCYSYKEDNQDFNDPSYGYFDSVRIPSNVKANSQMTVEAVFVPKRDFDGLLFETNINQQNFQPLSVVESDRSACDNSRFFASKYVNVKKGEPVELKLTVNTGSREGEFTVELYAVKGCSSDVGYDELLNDNLYTQQITITGQEDTNNGDGIDTDGDGVDDIYDYCPLDVGIADTGAYPEGEGNYLGCHPCEGLSDTSSCWDNSEYDKFTDPRSDGSESGSTSGEGLKSHEEVFEEYVKQREAEEFRKQKESCNASGRDFIDGKCVSSQGDDGETTKAEKCKNDGLLWNGDKCVDPEGFDKDLCDENNGTFVDGECVYSYPGITGPPDPITPDVPNEFCGDNICSLDETPQSCPFDCKEDTTCEGDEVNMMYCPDGSEILGEVCVDGEFKSAGNSCETSGSDEGFIQENVGIITSIGVVIAGIVGAVVLL